MAPSNHTPLFHPRVVRERVAALPAVDEAMAQGVIRGWLQALARGDLDETKETGLHGEFLVRVFGDVLGYRTLTGSNDGRWELVAEKGVLAGSADGAVGFFGTGAAPHVVAPVELKGATHFLDHARGRALTPVQQAWDYANKLPESRWIVVSNYRETRLYAKSRGPGAYERFLLSELGDPAMLRRFCALLGRAAMLPSTPGESSPLDEMLRASERVEREITEKLYAEYRGVRVRLFAELRATYPQRKPVELLRITQTILDRVLFLAFAEDRALIPPDTIREAVEHRDRYHPRPVWENLQRVFHWVDAGNGQPRFDAYNGGLFRGDADLDAVQVSDAACGWFRGLASYDFRDDVSVEVLGHIFEQSIADLEELRAEASAEDGEPVEKPSKRKTQGIFYTPSFVTSFLVRETLGKVFAERWDASVVGRNATSKERIATLEAYQASLRSLRVLDPACGSGAFLVAAFDAFAQEYERVTAALAELRGGQQGLFDPTRVTLHENLFGVDLESESVEITRLSLWLKTATRGKPLTHLDRNIRCGNSVVSHGTLDRRAFDWTKGGPVRALHEAPSDDPEAPAIEARWRDGFDVVLGNPPYVRQELLTKFKEHWRTEFRSYAGTADLFVYFFERGLQVLRNGGRLGFIVSNKWLRGGYAEALRRLLGDETTVETLVDFGHAPIFPDADAFPCIVTLRKAPPPPEHAVAVTQFPREELGHVGIAEYVEEHREAIPQRRFDRGGWSLESSRTFALMEKVRRAGVPLADWSGVKPCYGVKTGCNEAFLIDDALKQELCREDPRSKELLKKFLRGQDIARWSPEWAGLWMIFARRGVDLTHYPAIERHLGTFRDRLEPKPANWKGKAWPGRKPGSYKWYEIQDSIDYHALFDAPKIVYQVIQFHQSYALDRDGFMLNDKGFFLPTDSPWLLAALNAPLLWWFNWRYLVHLKDEALSPLGEKMVALPIAPPTDAQRAVVEAMAPKVVALTKTNHEHVAAVTDSLRVQFGVAELGQRLQDFPSLDEATFVDEVVKRQGDKKRKLSPTALRQVRALFQTEAPPVQERRVEIARLERALAAEVHAAYGLTAEDEALMWETAPPRMPWKPMSR